MDFVCFCQDRHLTTYDIYITIQTMTRTQVYLAEDQQLTLHQIAKANNTSMSKLIREGIDLVIKEKTGGQTRSQQFLKSLLSYPDKYRVKLPKSSVKLVREERD